MADKTSASHHDSPLATSFNTTTASLSSFGRIEPPLTVAFNRYLKSNQSPSSPRPTTVTPRNMRRSARDARNPS
ncbi:hypothetical protein IG631_07635 [Alternaria alternata]|nr:hypothetical protein IG631_07635 [Alternaria alternata]